MEKLLSLEWLEDVKNMLPVDDVDCEEIVNHLRKGIELHIEGYRVYSDNGTFIADIVPKVDTEALQDVYKEWYDISVEICGETNCGLCSVREDFSTYAGLDHVIHFRDMLKLERQN